MLHEAHAMDLFSALMQCNSVGIHENRNAILKRMDVPCLFV